MRCDVLGAMELEGSLVDDPSGSLNTDIQIWRENTESKTTPFIPCECRELARVYNNVGSSDKSGVVTTASLAFQTHPKHCNRNEVDSKASISSTATTSTATSDYHRNIVHGPDNKSSACGNSDSDDDDDASNLVETALPPTNDKRERNRESELRKLKSNCKPEELQKLKIQCEVSFTFLIIFFILYNAIPFIWINYFFFFFFSDISKRLYRWSACKPLSERFSGNRR